MIHASLFSGIGGPEVAAKMMGWENAFHCEINPFGKAVLDYWFPESKSYEDITKTSFKEWRGRIDVLTGGFPCQPFSYAGKRGGRNDDRYLWPEMLRVIDEVRPTWVVGENVAGITTMVEGGVCVDLGSEASLFAEGDGLHRYELDRTFTIERICRDLEHLGYSVQSVLIPAAAVGAPHRRDRVFIIAHDDVGDTAIGASGRQSGEDEGKEGEERIPQRDNLRKSGDASEVRSEGSGNAPTDTSSEMCHGGSAQTGRERQANREEREHHALAGTFRPRTPRTVADTECGGSGTPSPEVHTGVADGDEHLRDGSGRYAPDSACGGCQAQEEGGSEPPVGGVLRAGRTGMRGRTDWRTIWTLLV